MVIIWLLVLMNKIPDDKGFCHLLNKLIEGVFCHGGSSSPLVTHLKTVMMQKLFQKKDVMKFISCNYIWLAYAAALGSQSSMGLSVESLDQPLEKAIEGSTLEIWSTIAFSLNDNILGLIFWEKFFVLYFELAAKHSDLGNTKKDTFNNHFIALAKKFENSNRTLYSLYYSFTTWAEEVVIDHGNFLSDVKSETFGVFKAHFPSYFYRSTSTQPSNLSEYLLREPGLHKREQLIAWILLLFTPPVQVPYSALWYQRRVRDLYWWCE
eukprot:TRINITY_DN8114_c0_g1_i1.p2 TRINITY_DN8114_c0_g1~~TRINITY_DN8114_c0_g1_i1.p2  ORF type:complete len:300 (-),score=69.85 TRINITY_DN8114_c0_g1_i1:818-1615(-)